MSSYVTLQTARRQLATDTSGAIATANDPTLWYYCQVASAAIDDYTGRWFSERYQLIGFDSATGPYNPILLLDDYPLVAVDTLTNGDGTAIASTSYALLPVGRYPKDTVRLNQGVYFVSPNPYSTTANCYPYYAPPTAYSEDAVQISGTWCYHTNYRRAWTLTTLTLTSGIDATATTLTLTGTIGTQLDVGSIIYIPTGTSGAYEQMLVTGPLSASTPSAFTGSTIEVIRDYDNYTDTSRAAAHTTGQAIYVFTPEPMITFAAAQAAAAFYKQRDNATGDTQIIQGFGSGSVVIPQDLPARIKRELFPYWSHIRGRAL